MIRLPSLRRARRAASVRLAARAVLESVESRRLMTTTLDTTYNTHGDGRVSPASEFGTFNLVDVLADGRSVTVSQVVSEEYAPASNAFEITRLTANGDLDLTFGGSGRKTFSLPGVADGEAENIAGTTADDGSILLSYTTIGFDENDSPISVAHVSRITPDGNLQLDFAGDGSLELPGDVDGTTVALASSGGDLYVGWNEVTAAGPQVHLQHVSLSTGNVDIGFGTGGVASAAVGPTQGSGAVVATAAGAVFFTAGSDISDVAGAGLDAVRFGADGSVVASNHIAGDSFGMVLGSAVATPTGFLVAGLERAGLQPADTSHVFQLDANLNAAGFGHREVADVPGFSLYADGTHARSIARDSAGKIYLGGYTTDFDTGEQTDALVRLNADGTLDRFTFGSNGVFFYNTGAFASAAAAVRVVANDAVVVGSYSYWPDNTGAADFYKLLGNPVTPPPPPVQLPYTISNGTLALVAGDGNDVVTLTGSAGAYTLTVNGTAYAIGGSITGIKIDGGAGNDTIKIASSVTIPVTILGGAGDDSLRGGSGDDVIDGGTGNDALVGGAGRDFMIGGTGADYLVGLVGDDILLNGTTNLDLLGIKAVMAEWTSNHLLAVKYLNLSGLLPLPGRLNGNSFLTPEVTIFNDTSVDTLSGGAGTDFAYAQLWGQNADVVRDNLATYRADVMALIAN